MVNFCSVYKCTNSTTKNPRLGFFLIPADSARQKIWLPKIGRAEWIHKNPDSLHKRRVCGEHFPREMISGSRLKSDAFPCIFKEGIGEKAVNVNASTSASSSSVNIENKEIEDVSISASSPVVDIENKKTINMPYVIYHIIPIINSTQEKKSGETQTPPKLSVSTPRKRKLIFEPRILRKKNTTIAEKDSDEDISDEGFIRFCRKNFNSGTAEFMISQLKHRRKNPHGHRYIQ